jgi:acid phosphatase
MTPIDLSRRTLLAAAGTSLLTSQAHAADQTLPFLVVGDWGREGADKQLEVAQAMGQTAAAIGSRLVISVGDNFYEDGVDSLTDKQWKTSFEDIYTHPALQTRWDVILGNHDYRGNVQAQIDYSARSPRWRMPARYFQRQERLGDGTVIEFFYIDTSPMLDEYHKTNKVRVRGQDVPAQLAWLDAALGASKAHWKIVVGHHPIHTVTGGKRDTKELIRDVLPILQRHHVRVYLNGHDHNLQVLTRGGVTFITCGAGSEVYEPGAAPAGQFASGHHGFMSVELSAAKFAYRLIDDTGAELYASQITA